MSDLLKPCVECGELSDGPRCLDHRPTDIKGNTKARGYDSQWDRLSKKARRLQPFCIDCGSTDDLTTDHSPEAWKRKERGLPIRLEDVAVVCRSDNAKRGAARLTPGEMTPSSQASDPLGRQSSS